jgi:hypothetical protein
MYSNHRQFFTFLDIKKYGADLVCCVLGQLKNIFEQNSESRIHALRQLFSGSVR